MDLILDRLYSRVDTIDQKLVLIKQNLIDKGLDENICNQNFSKLETDNNKSLEVQFKNTNEKVLRSSNKPFVVGQIFKQNKSSNFNSSGNNSNNNDTLASGTSSLNSHTSSRSVRIDPERNRYSTYSQHSPISSRSSSNNYNNRNNNYNNNQFNSSRHNNNQYSRRNNNFRTNSTNNHFNAFFFERIDFNIFYLSTNKRKQCIINFTYFFLPMLKKAKYVEFHFKKKLFITKSFKFLSKKTADFKATSSQREPLVKRTQNGVGHYQSNVFFPIKGISKDLIKKISQINKDNKARETRASKHTNIATE